MRLLALPVGSRPFSLSSAELLALAQVNNGTLVYSSFSAFAFNSMAKGTEGSREHCSLN